MHTVCWLVAHQAALIHRFASRHAWFAARGSLSLARRLQFAACFGHFFRAKQKQQLKMAVLFGLG